MRWSTYDGERESRADEKIAAIRRVRPISSRRRARLAALFRDAVLDLASASVCARAGQQRTAVGAGTIQRSAAEHAGPGRIRRRMAPGAPATDAPADGAGWLLRRLTGNGFAALSLRRRRRRSERARGASRLGRRRTRRHYQAAGGRSRGRALRRPARHDLPIAPRPARRRTVAQARNVRHCRGAQACDCADLKESKWNCSPNPISMRPMTSTKR